MFPTGKMKPTRADADHLRLEATHPIAGHCRNRPPPPTLGERRHRGLAGCGIAVRGHAVLLMSERPHHGAPMVQARIAEIMRVGAERAEVTAEEVIRELKKLGFSCIGKAVTWRNEVVTQQLEEGEEGETRTVMVPRVMIGPPPRCGYAPCVGRCRCRRAIPYLNG